MQTCHRFRGIVFFCKMSHFCDIFCRLIVLECVTHKIMNQKMHRLMNFTCPIVVKHSCKSRLVSYSLLQQQTRALPYPINWNSSNNLSIKHSNPKDDWQLRPKIEFKLLPKMNFPIWRINLACNVAQVCSKKIIPTHVDYWCRYTLSA